MIRISVKSRPVHALRNTQISVPSLGAYSISKAAALSFHETLQNELGTRYNAPNIRATVVCPMKTTTMLGEFLSDPIPFLTPTLRPETVARRIVRSIDAGLSQHHMMPAYTNIMPLMRGLPSWFQSGFFGVSTQNNCFFRRSSCTLVDWRDEQRCHAPARGESPTDGVSLFSPAPEVIHCGDSAIYHYQVMRACAHMHSSFTNT